MVTGPILNSKENDKICDEKVCANFNKNEFLKYVAKQRSRENLLVNYKKIIRHITMSMKMLANAYYKHTPFLEASDIEYIKNSLNSYVNNNEKIKSFKNTLIDDLTVFQSQIQMNHTEKINNLIQEKEFCEKQIRVFDIAKHKLIRNKLSNIQWPYDLETQEYENKITTLKIKLTKLEEKIDGLRKMRPFVNEKEIIIYQMRLKEKYSI